MYKYIKQCCTWFQQNHKIEEKEKFWLIGSTCTDVINQETRNWRCIGTPKWYSPWLMCLDRIFKFSTHLLQPKHESQNFYGWNIFDEPLLSRDHQIPCWNPQNIWRHLENKILMIIFCKTIHINNIWFI